MRKLLILAAIGLTANLATSCGSDESGSSSSPGVDVTGVWAVPGSGGWDLGDPRLPGQFIAWEDSINCQNCGQDGARVVGKTLLQNRMTPANPQWSCTPDNYQHQAWMDVFAAVEGNTVTGTFTSSINQTKCSTTAGGNCYHPDHPFPARFDITLKVVFSGTIEWSPNSFLPPGICALVGNFTKTMVGPNAAEAPPGLCNHSGEFVFYLSEFDRPLWSGPPYCSELNLLDHTADLTFGSTTVTMDDTSQLVVGKDVISVISSGATLVQTDDLPNGTTVASITDSTTFEVSLAAQATVTNASLMFLLTLPQECMEPDTKWVPKAVTEEECLAAAPPAS